VGLAAGDFWKKPQPTNFDWDEWNNAGMAIYAASGGSQPFVAFDDLCAQSPKYTPYPTTSAGQTTSAHSLPSRGLRPCAVPSRPNRPHRLAGCARAAAGSRQRPGRRSHAATSTQARPRPAGFRAAGSQAWRPAARAARRLSPVGTPRASLAAATSRRARLVRDRVAEQAAVDAQSPRQRVPVICDDAVADADTMSAKHSPGLVGALCAHGPSLRTLRTIGLIDPVPIE
jgi:hypothetical protein